MSDKGTAIQLSKQSAPLKIVEPEKLVEHIRETFDAIARRAFSIFEGNGESESRDLDNWFKAESELLHPVHVDISEAGNDLTLSAEVPGFKAEELEVSVEPRRVTITGKRQKQEEKKRGGTVIYCERCSDQLLRVVDLPTDVSRENVTASLKDGVLELVLQKSEAAKKVPITKRA